MFDDKVIYDIGNLADWFAAISTFFTLIFSIVLATRDSRKKGKVTYRMLKYEKLGTEKTEIIQVCIINTRIKSINLRSFGICNKLLWSEKDFFKFNENKSIDKTLNTGEFYDEINLDLGNIKKLYKGLGYENKKLLKSYLYFEDIEGKKYKTKIDLRN